MSYVRAEAVLPQELIETIQQYVSGTNIYIPCKDKKSWGSETNSPSYYKNRNGEICKKHSEGISVNVLADEYSLSVKSIQRIIREHHLSGEDSE